mmetsp:Transcript_110412/g.293289  ORF Transcript_110412/g.293289 Transcript_110412/m.293289 type:complete len:149 (+) Transcript_110412:846-1292(+)
MPPLTSFRNSSVGSSVTERPAKALNQRKYVSPSSQKTGAAEASELQWLSSEASEDSEDSEATEGVGLRDFDPKCLQGGLKPASGFLPRARWLDLQLLGVRGPAPAAVLEAPWAWLSLRLPAARGRRIDGRLTIKVGAPPLKVQEERWD